MDPERKHEVVDLDRYKKAVQAQAQARSKAPRPPAGEPVLGARPRAGLILLLVLAVVVGFWFLTRLG